MQKCGNCGTEFEGKFCPECGSRVGEIRICPVCGKPSGGTRFCTECGYSFVSEEKKFENKQKQPAFLSWCKKHKNVLILSSFALVLLITLLSLIPTFILASVNGTYYRCTQEGLSETDYVKLSTGKWFDGKNSGKYKVKGSQVTLIYINEEMSNMFGEDSSLAKSELVGTVKNNVLVLQGSGNTVARYCKKNHQHQYSDWKVKIEATCLQDGLDARTCICGHEQTQRIPQTAHHYEWTTTKEPTCVENGVSSHICTVCGDKTDTKEIPITGHNFLEGYCTVCQKIQLEYQKNSDGYAVMGFANGFNSQNIEILNEYNNSPVTSIRDFAFYGCSSLTSVVIPDSITSIGWSAFMDCSSLTDITYRGTKAEWEAIEKSVGWDRFTSNYTIHCTDGDIKKGE